MCIAYEIKIILINVKFLKYFFKIVHYTYLITQII
jgi:hypothetical protein